MTKREKVVAALTALVEKYEEVVSTGKTVSPDGIPMNATFTARAVKMIDHFAKNEVKGLTVTIREWFNEVVLRINPSSSTSLNTLFDQIEQANVVLAGPLFDIKTAEDRRVESQLRFIGAVRKELDLLEKKIRNNRVGADISAYDFERTVARLRKELWP